MSTPRFILFVVASGVLFGRSGGPVAAQQADAAVRRDAHGDPLPDGAIARIGSVRLRQPHLHNLAFSPDMRTLATLGLYGDLQLWNVTTGQPIQSLERTKGLAIQFSKDGTLLASFRGGDKKVTIWAAANGKILGQWNRSFYGFLPEDTLLPNGKVRVHDIDAPMDDPGLKMLAKPGTQGWCSPNGAYLMIHSYSDDTIRLWDVAREKFVAALKPERSPKPDPRPDYRARGANHNHLYAVGFTTDNQTFLASWGSELLVWDILGERRRFLLPVQDAHAIATSPDSKTLAAALPDGSVVLFSLQSGQELRRWKADCYRWGRVAFSRDGKVLASTTDCAVRYWDPRTGKRVGPFLDFDVSPLAITFSRDGETLMVDSDNLIGLFDVEPFRQRASIERHFWGPSAIYSMDSRTVAFLSVDRDDDEKASLRAFDIATKKERLLINLPQVYNPLLTSDAGGFRIYTQSEEGQLVARDGTTGKEVFRHKWGQIDDEDRGWPIVSPDGTILASVERDFRHPRRIVLRDAATAKKRLDIELPKEIAAADDRFDRDPKTQLVLAGFSGDARTVLAVVADIGGNGDPLTNGTHELMLWETATGLSRGRIKAGPGKFSAYAFSRDGRVLAAAAGNILRVLDPATGEELRKFGGHGAVVRAMGLSPDGRTLVSGGADATLTLWDTEVIRKDMSKKLCAEGLKQCWAELIGADSVLAYRAIGLLSRHPEEAVPFLRDRFGHRPAPAVDPKTVVRWITELGDERFVVRERASAELARAGPPARPALQEALATSSLDVRRRLEILLARLDELGSGNERIRSLRAVEALEHIGSAEARQVLRDVQSFGPRPIAEDSARSLTRLSAGPVAAIK